MRKPEADGEIKLYTDIESKIAHYTKVKNMFKAAGIIEAVLLCAELICAAIAYNPSQIIFASILACIIFVFIFIIDKTKDKINKLKEEQTGIAAEEKRKFSIFLQIGLLLNLCALLLKDEFSDYSSCIIIMQIIAIVLMLAGICDMARKRNN